MDDVKFIRTMPAEGDSHRSYDKWLGKEAEESVPSSVSEEQTTFGAWYEAQPDADGRNRAISARAWQVSSEGEIDRLKSIVERQRSEIVELKFKLNFPLPGETQMSSVPSSTSEEIPHRVQIALARILDYFRGDVNQFPERVLNELLDVWEHYSIKLRVPSSSEAGVRENFEKWAWTRGFRLFDRESSGYYTLSALHDVWMGYEAGRQSLSAELEALRGASQKGNEYERIGYERGIWEASRAYGAHVHQALYDEEGKLTEDCKLCHQNYRDSVHLAVGETRESRIAALTHGNGGQIE